MENVFIRATRYEDTSSVGWNENMSTEAIIIPIEYLVILHIQAEVNWRRRRICESYECLCEILAKASQGYTDRVIQLCVQVGVSIISQYIQ